MILQNTNTSSKPSQAMQARNEMRTIFLLIVNLIMFQVESNINVITLRTSQKHDV
jgi:hypothetical protein